MRRLNIAFFVALVALIAVFIGVILVRDATNRHHYERFEQATLEKTSQLTEQNEQMAGRLMSMEADLDSLQATRLSDSNAWYQERDRLKKKLARSEYFAAQLKTKLNESIRNQTIVVPLPPHRRDFDRIAPGDSTTVPARQ